jgi:ubiquinone/menaquinone biosynthesis C-methylase UbiE
VVLAQQYIEKFFNNSSNLNIECSFKQGDLETLNIEDKKYDISFVPSVLERVSDISIERVVEQVCRITKKYIYISDFFDHYPDGWPRDHKKQSDIFLKYGFELREFRYHMTDTARNQCELQLLFQRSILN